MVGWSDWPLTSSVFNGQHSQQVGFHWLKLGPTFPGWKWSNWSNISCRTMRLLNLEMAIWVWSILLGGEGDCVVWVLLPTRGHITRCFNQSLPRCGRWLIIGNTPVEDISCLVARIPKEKASQAILPDCHCQFVLALRTFSSYWQWTQSVRPSV